MSVILDVPLEVEASDLVPEDEMWLYWRDKRGEVRLARIANAKALLGEFLKREEVEA